MKKIILTLLVVLSSSLWAQKTDVLYSGEDVIWGFDFLPDGRIIFTERMGKLNIFDPKTKKATTITGTPKVRAEGQGGLLDVRVHPKNGYIYFTFAKPLEEKKSATTLAYAKINGTTLTDYKELFSAKEPSTNDYHFGSRIEFDGKGHIFMTSGERGERPMVQKLGNHLGKVIRLNEDGSIPKDNPYVNTKNAKPEIWAIGIRSPQGLMIRPGTSELWETEMGPKGGDELNLIEKTKNYGWPIITWGTEYDGPKIGEGTMKEGMEQPKSYWVPSISPSAFTFYTGDKMPAWKGNIILALLSGQHLRRLELQGTKVVKQEELFKDLGWRFRNVRTGPDGYLYFSTDEGKIGRVLPK